MKKYLKKLESVLPQVITYCIMFILGLITMIFPGMGYDKPAIYASILFYAVAFFSFGSYFYFRKNKQNYEVLYFSLITILVASYLFIFEYASLSYALGTGFLAFTVLNTINRVAHINKLKNEDNSLWTMRAICLILILFLAVLTIQNFYREISIVQTVMIGYYFLTYGLLALAEVILLVYVKPETFEKFMNGEFDKLGKSKKISKLNENVDELDKIVKKIDAPKKKKTKKKTIKKKVTKK